MRAPVRPLAGAWPAAVERRLGRFFRPDPKVLLDPQASPERFSAAMSAIHVGDTIKITEPDRHPIADDLVLEHLDLTGATILDIGASDGSTSLDLIRKLPGFGAYVVADLYLRLHATPALRHLVLTDESGEPVLVAGRWWAAWPAGSRAVTALTRPVTRAAARRPDARSEVLLLNPALQDLMARDPRVTAQVHDVFTPWTGPAPDLIKVANLLRRVYFTEEQIDDGLRALRDSLPEGGHLLVVDDGHRYSSYVHDSSHKGSGARAGLYRRAGQQLVLVAQTETAPEIAEQVAALGA